MLTRLQRFTTAQKSAASAAKMTTLGGLPAKSHVPYFTVAASQTATPFSSMIYTPRRPFTASEDEGGTGGAGEKQADAPAANEAEATETAEAVKEEATVKADGQQAEGGKRKRQRKKKANTAG